MRPLLLALLAATLAVPLTHAPAAAQERSYAPSVSGAELARARASNLLAALLRTRPAWFATVGDTAWNQGFESVVVYLNGRHLGDLGVVRSLSAETVEAVRLVSEDYIRQRDPRYPRTGFTYALWISTARSASEAERRTRRTFAVYAVAPLPGMQASLDRALADGGLDATFYADDRIIVRMEEKGRRYAPGIGATAAIGVSPRLGVEIQAEHLPELYMGRMNRPPSYAVGASFSWTDVALLGTYRQWPFRFGAGPVVRTASWEWGEGTCGCRDIESSRSTGYGVALNGAFTVPVAGPAHVEARVGVRHFLSHELPSYRQRPELNLRGTEGVASIGLGMRL